MVYGFKGLVEHFLSTHPGHHINPKRINGSGVETLFGQFKHTTSGNLTGHTYQTAKATLMTKRAPKGLDHLTVILTAIADVSTGPIEVTAPCDVHNVFVISVLYEVMLRLHAFRVCLYANSIVTAATSHTRRKLKAAEKWKELRNNCSKILIEGYSLPKVFCSFCTLREGIVRCLQCGPMHILL